MFVVEDEIVLKALDESPRFRAQYINKKVLKSEELVKLVYNQYNLNLIEDVYINKVNVESYNSQKRLKLKEQELILIKKFKIFDSMQNNLEHMLTEIFDIDLSFTSYFGNDFHETTDYDFGYQLIFTFVNQYFEEYERRSEKRHDDTT